jgi:3-hydroxyisobutyrate dehydrogenase
MSKTIGVLGLGQLGSTLTEKFLKSGYTVWVYNRTLEKSEALLDKGAKVADTLAKFLQNVDVVLISLFDAEAIEHVLLTSADIKNKTFLSLTSTTCEDAATLNKKFVVAGAKFLDVAIISGAAEVAAGTSQTIASGDKSVYEATEKLLAEFSNNLKHISTEAGHASSIETSFGIILVYQVSSYALSMAISKKDGAPLDAFAATMQEMPLINVPLFPYYADSMGSQNYENPIWRIGNMAKSTRMFMRHMKQVGVGVELFAPVLKLIEGLEANGYKEKNFTAIYDGVLKSSVKEPVLG